MLINSTYKPYHLWVVGHFDDCKCLMCYCCIFARFYYWKMSNFCRDACTAINQIGVFSRYVPFLLVLTRDIMFLFWCVIVCCALLCLIMSLYIRILCELLWMLRLPQYISYYFKCKSSSMDLIKLMTMKVLLCFHIPHYFPFTSEVWK